MFPDSFNMTDHMPGKYSITLDPNILAVQYRRCKVPIEAKEEIETKLREMTAKDSITLQAEPTAWVRSPTYDHNANGTLRVPLG